MQEATCFEVWAFQLDEFQQQLEKQLAQLSDLLLTCQKCKVRKPLSDFSTNQRRFGGDHHCKQCLRLEEAERQRLAMEKEEADKKKVEVSFILQSTCSCPFFSHKLSKADLLQLVEVSGKSLPNTVCNLSDLADNHGQLIPSTTFASLVERAEANWNALARLKREVLAFLIASETDLFASKAAAHELSLTLSAMDTLFQLAGSGSHTLTYLLSFTRARQSFSSMQELTISIRSAHLATMNIAAAQTEREVQQVLHYLSTSKHIVQLFAAAVPPPPAAASSSFGQPQAIAPSIAVSDAGVREMLKLAGSANGVVTLLNLLYDKGVKVANFQELLQNVKRQAIQQYK